MVSNEGRREVANWLRLSGKSLGFDNCFAQMLCDVAGTDLPPEDFDAAGYLADLIDRPAIKPESSGRAYWRCPRCGAFNYRSAVTDCCGVIPSHYCANCGAEVVSDDD